MNEKNNRIEDKNALNQPVGFRPSDKTRELLETAEQIGIKRTDLLNQLVESYGMEIISKSIDGIYAKLNKIKGKAPILTQYPARKIKKCVDHILGSVQTPSQDLVINHV